MSITVELTDTEVYFAAIAGVGRHLESFHKKRRDAHGLSRDDGEGICHHILGAAGELAVAKCKGKYFSGAMNTFKTADLGESVQVRTRSRHDWNLNVRKDDNEQHAFILVTATIPIMVIHGWLWGHEAMKLEYLKSHGGREEAYFVPQSRLRSIHKKKDVDVTT